MKSKLTRVAIALTALLSCAAFAQTDTDADNARRQRNVDEVLAKHHVDLDRMNSSDAQTMPSEHRTMHSRTHHIAHKARAKGHEIARNMRADTHATANDVRAESHTAAEGARSGSHAVAQKARHATHRAAEKIRDMKNGDTTEGKTDSNNKAVQAPTS